MRRFFFKLAGTEHDRQCIKGADMIHIRDVLRLKSGDEIELVEGKGVVYKAKIKKILPEKIEVAVFGKISPGIVESPVEITVAQALPKGKKADTLIRQLTELGVAKWMAFISERSVPKIDPKKMARRIEKWEKIAKESLKQCRRLVLPEIGCAQSLGEVLETGKKHSLKIIFHTSGDSGPETLSREHRHEEGLKILAVFGPEGGFTDREIENAARFGFSVIRLGPRILRAETAAIAGISILQYIFGDFGNKNP